MKRVTIFAKLLAVGDPRRAISRKAFFWIAMATILLDQMSKGLAVWALRGREPVALLPGFFQLWYRTNTGAAFSFAEGRTGMLAVFSAVISLAVVIWAWRLPPSERGLRLPLGLILGGAIGNLIDRVRLGYVIDFLDAYVVWKGEHHWPTFNLADSAVCVGMTLLILASFCCAKADEGSVTPAAGSGAESACRNEARKKGARGFRGDEVVNTPGAGGADEK
ncbi:MAG: signal peptidase II [bacterium]|nr:signal peptidase II [bacterium]